MKELPNPEIFGEKEAFTFLHKKHSVSMILHFYAGTVFT